MATIQRKVIFTVDYDPEKPELKINLAFEPGLAGPESEEWAKMSNDEKIVQNYTANIGGMVMQVLNHDAQPRQPEPQEPG